MSFNEFYLMYIICTLICEIPFIFLLNYAMSKATKVAAKTFRRNNQENNNNMTDSDSDSNSIDGIGDDDVVEKFTWRSTPEVTAGRKKERMDRRRKPSVCKYYCRRGICCSIGNVGVKKIVQRRIIFTCEIGHRSEVEPGAMKSKNRSAFKKK